MEIAGEVGMCFEICEINEFTKLTCYFPQRNMVKLIDVHFQREFKQIFVL